MWLGSKDGFIYTSCGWRKKAELCALSDTDSLSPFLKQFPLQVQLQEGTVQHKLKSKHQPGFTRSHKRQWHLPLPFFRRCHQDSRPLNLPLHTCVTNGNMLDKVVLTALVVEVVVVLVLVVAVAISRHCCQQEIASRHAFSAHGKLTSQITFPYFMADRDINNWL